MSAKITLPTPALFLMLIASSAFGATIEKKSFGSTADGLAVDQYILTTDKGASASVITYGATLTRLQMPDQTGKLGDVIVGFDNVNQYQNQTAYFGATIGRVGNRIARGLFSIDKQRFAVPVNNGPNHLHGGFKGYDKRIWDAESAMTTNGPGVRFTLVDPDGDEGYPGTVRVTVIYSLSNDNTLEIQYYATTDKATPINLTNHAYFNLKDGGASGIGDHIMKAYADHYTPVDDTQIPTGEIAPVKGTPIDFTSPKPMGRDMDAMGGKPAGYDHNLVLNNQDGSLAKAAEVYEPVTGRLLEVWTTEPGMQFYTGNFLDGSVKGRGDVAYQEHSAFAMEAQHYPDSVNHSNFPNTVVRPGEVYRQITEYRFPAPGKQPW
jgi:aldose 1-epimerase